MRRAHRARLSRWYQAGFAEEPRVESRRALGGWEEGGTRRRRFQCIRPLVHYLRLGRFSGGASGTTPSGGLLTPRGAAHFLLWEARASNWSSSSSPDYQLVTWTLGVVCSIQREPLLRGKEQACASDHRAEQCEARAAGLHRHHHPLGGCSAGAPGQREQQLRLRTQGRADAPQREKGTRRLRFPVYARPFFESARRLDRRVASTP